MAQAGSESVQLQQIIQNVNFASFGALAVQIWEFANSFFSEAEYLCGSRFTLVKSLYIWSRYISLVGQIVNLALTQMYEASLEATGPASGLSCKGIFVYKVVMAQQALTCVEIILLIRVYALYNQSRRVKYFLCTIFLATFTLEMWSNGQIIEALIKRKSCTMSEKIIPFTSTVAFWTSASCYQGLILCMTLFKYFVRHHGRARTPLTSLILREGIVIYFMTFGTMVINVICVTVGSIQIRILGDANLAWFISLLSVMGCRLILDMRNLNVSHSGDDYGIDFTSNLNMSESESA